ncbi:MAG: cyclodeaminase/cyclohydrolase family protein [Erysipelotrichaceae bacterium]
MDKMKEMSLNDFIDDLASDSFSPGGGAACALVGAIANSLAVMAANLTKDKKKFIDKKEYLEELIEKSTELNHSLLKAMDEDKTAFQPLAQAYKLSKDDPQKPQKIQQGLLSAYQAPYNLLSTMVEVTELLQQYSENCSKLVLSDVATSAALIIGAVYGIKINVFVNTADILDQKTKLTIEKQTNQMADECLKRAENIYRQASERIIK